MKQPNVAFVGIGVLGGPIVERLLAAGIVVTVYDVRPEVIADAVALGAVPAGSPGEAAAAGEVTFVCVRTDEQCVEAVEGPGGILGSAEPGHVVALLATVHPATATTLALAAQSRGVELVDAPLAGTGPQGVREGSMWALIGGVDSAVAVVEPLLAEICQRVVHTGPVGSGSAAKLAHNVMIYLSYLGATEAAGLARVSGVREGVLVELTRATGALSGQADILLEIHERRRSIGAGPDPEADYFRGASALLAKDLGHAVELAREGGLELPGAALTRGLGAEIYQVQ